MKQFYKILALVFLLTLVLAIAGCKTPLKEEKEDVRECFEDTECIKVQMSCCPCNMGGEEECVSLAAAPIYNNFLDDCKSTDICPALYNCNIKRCDCYQNKCRAIRENTTNSS